MDQREAPRADMAQLRRRSTSSCRALDKAPDLPNVPLAIDLVKNETDRQIMQLMLSDTRIASPLIAPGGVPAQRVSDLRKGFDRMMTDAEFVKEADEARNRSRSHARRSIAGGGERHVRPFAGGGQKTLASIMRSSTLHAWLRALASSSHAARRRRNADVNVLIASAWAAFMI
jgi:hypothetical protein